ncbi:hypothetical protein MANES_14G163650v8 [Manihot esculenta]|uniref:Uncharacterized protein n=1 Tax=Manihot esculenta TaxID=3983 RepID=A0ACB7GIV7_MANES|nr:hypothetical protein MANES_14G163650v8 [Manihot esculenta]
MIAQLRRPTSNCPAASLACPLCSLRVPALRACLAHFAHSSSPAPAALLHVPQAQLAKALPRRPTSTYQLSMHQPTASPATTPPTPIGTPQSCSLSSSFTKFFRFLRGMGRVVTIIPGLDLLTRL